MARNQAATNAVWYGARGGQPIRVLVQGTGAWVAASVREHGPQPPCGLAAEAGQGESRAGGWGGWGLRRLVEAVRLERVRLGTRVTLGRALRPAGILAPEPLSRAR